MQDIPYSFISQFAIHSSFGEYPKAFRKRMQDKPAENDELARTRDSNSGRKPARRAAARAEL